MVAGNLSYGYKINVEANASQVNNLRTSMRNVDVDVKNIKNSVTVAGVAMDAAFKSAANNAAKLNTQVNSLNTNLGKMAQIKAMLPPEASSLLISKNTAGEIVSASATTKKPIITSEGTQLLLTQKQAIIDINDQWKTGSSTLDSLLPKLNSIRWTMVNVGFAAAAIIGPLTALTMIGNKFDLEMRQIAMVTETTLGTVKETLVSLSQGSKFSLSEMGTGFLEFAKAGYTFNETTKAMPDISKLAIIGFTDMNTAAIGLAQALNTFNLSADESSKVVDILSSVANKSTLDVSSLMSALGLVGNIADSMNLSLEDTSVALGALANSGLRGTKAGSSLRQMLTDLISPSAKAQKIFEAQGFAIQTFNDGTLDLVSTVKQLDKILTDTGLSINDVFGNVRGASGFAALRDAIKSSEEQGTSLQDKFVELGTSTTKLADINEANVNRMKRVWNGFMNDDLIPTGDLLGKILSMSFEGWMSGLSGSVRMGQFNTELEKTIALEKGRRERTGASPLTQEEEDMMRIEGVSKKVTDFYDKYNKLKESENNGTNPIPKMFQTSFQDFMKNNPDFKISLDELNQLIDEHAQYVENVRKGSDEGNAKAREQQKYQLGVLQTDNEITKVQWEIADAKKAGNAQLEVSLHKELAELEYHKTILQIQDDEKNGLKGTALAQERRNFALEQYNEDIKTSNDLLDKQTTIMQTLYDYTKSINQTQLDTEQQALAATKKGMFIGEQQQLDNIHNIALNIKRAELAQLQLADATGKTVDELKNQNNEFDAWTETIKTMIEQSINAGNELGTDVTSRVGQLQTILMGQNMTAGSKKTDISAIDTLQNQLKEAQLQFDIGTGENRYQFEQFIKSVGDGSDVIFTSLEGAKDLFQTEFDNVRGLKEDIDALTTAWDNAARAKQKALLDNAGLSSTAGDSQSTASYIQDQQTKAYLKSVNYNGPTDAYGNAIKPNAEGKYVAHSFMDFISRPGEPPATFSPDDTIIGVKDTSKLTNGGNNITVSVNLNSVNPGYDAREFARQLSQELKRL